MSGSSSADAAGRAALRTPRGQLAHRAPTVRNGRALLLLRNEGGARSRHVSAAGGAA
jgi:hypothetical protein